MRINTQLLIACIALFIFTFPTIAAPQGKPVGSGRSKLYSIAGVNRFCQAAQRIIANTGLDSTNIVHNSLDSFIESSPAPYADKNAAAYNGTGDSGETLPLTTQEFITFAKFSRFSWHYPQVISCKMKSSDAIQRFIGIEASGAEKTCQDVNRQTVSRVFANLTRYEKWHLVFPKFEIVFEPDVIARTGPEWLDPFPPDVAFIGDDGRLHIQGKSLQVPVDIDLPPSIPLGEDKKGLHYCHVPSPEYIRLIVKGRVRP